MSGSKPVWADHGQGGDWWSSPSGSPTRATRLRRQPDVGHYAGVGSFFPRLTVVQAIHNDGSYRRAQAIAAWVVSMRTGATTYVEALALGNWGVVVLRPGDSETLWVLTDQHLVFDSRRTPQLCVLSDDEFRACYEATFSPSRVRECPIYDDGEVAS